MIFKSYIRNFQNAEELPQVYILLNGIDLNGSAMGDWAAKNVDLLGQKGQMLPVDIIFLV